MKCWEYRVEEAILPLHEDVMNILGAQGWRFITSEPVRRGGDGVGWRYIFERRRFPEPRQVR